MKNNTSILIAALTLTALVLGVVLLSTNAHPAQANMLDSKPGFSIMTSGTVGIDEYLTIIDKAQGKMIVYNLVNNTLNPIAGYDLGKAMAPAPAGK